MFFSVEQAFVGREEKRAPLKTPVWEARNIFDSVKVSEKSGNSIFIAHKSAERCKGF